MSTSLLHFSLIHISQHGRPVRQCTSLRLKFSPASKSRTSIPSTAFRGESALRWDTSIYSTRRTYRAAERTVRNRLAVQVVHAGGATLQPSDSGPAIEISQAVTLLGSGDSVDVNIEGAAESHAKLEVKGNNVYLTDLGSGQGTWIDDNKLWPEVAYILGPNSAIALGGKGEESKVAEYSIVLEEAAPTSSADDFVMAAFKQSFEMSANEEVRKLLKETE